MMFIVQTLKSDRSETMNRGISIIRGSKFPGTFIAPPLPLGLNEILAERMSKIFYNL